MHLRHALDLKPDLSDAADALKEVESLPATSIHFYTLLIIVCLVRRLIQVKFPVSPLIASTAAPTTVVSKFLTSFSNYFK